MLALGAAACALHAAELQGVVVDWNCAKAMVQNDRGKVLQQQRSCSLMKNYKRAAYGLITDDKKFYRLDDQNNEHILRLLRDTPDKDNLKVVVTGDLDGNTLKVVTATIL